jgi:peroxiredoxin
MDRGVGVLTLALGLGTVVLAQSGSGNVAAELQSSARALVEQGARSEAVYQLRSALERYRGTPIGEQLETDIAVLSLEGRTAPALEPGVAIGPRLPHTDATRQPQLLFFWAHWCQECKGESPALARLTEKYRSSGLMLVAPTRRYGFVEAGRPASPDKELRHIAKVLDEHYPFLRQVPVPVADANYKAYGVAAVPMHVLIDRHGVVRLCQQGRMTEEELDAALRSVVEP